MRTSWYLFAIAFSATFSLTADPFTAGDLFASVGNGQVKVFSQNGQLKQTLSTGTGSQYVTGSAFDALGNFYVTGFDANVVSKFNSDGLLLNGAFARGFAADPESIVFDHTGNFFVGQSDGLRDIRKFDSGGNQIGSFRAATNPRGTDWIELGSDQTTIFYTSEGDSIHRFDTAANKQLADFADLNGGVSHALKFLPDGGMLVAHSSNVLRLDSTGQIAYTYTISGVTGQLYSLAVDPAGTSFWVAELGGNNRLYKLDLASGNILRSFATDPPNVLGGISIAYVPVSVPEPRTSCLLAICLIALALFQLSQHGIHQGAPKP